MATKLLPPTALPQLSQCHFLLSSPFLTLSSGPEVLPLPSENKIFFTIHTIFVKTNRVFSVFVCKISQCIRSLFCNWNWDRSKNLDYS